MSAPLPRIPVSWGELVDKVTILEIKAERISDATKLKHVRQELRLLLDVLARDSALSLEGAKIRKALRAVNERLWDVEDAIRVCERRQDFGPDFIELARSVYRLNDQRFAHKRRINELAGSRLVEEKSYADTGAGD